jgi:hypothetical protein
VSGAVRTTDLDFLDAGKVLSGQCAQRQARGETSQMIAITPGPYPVSPRPGGMKLTSAGDAAASTCAGGR